MTLNNQLFRNYNELRELILDCYKDISILRAYERLQNKKSDTYKMLVNISNHFVKLTQKDLALTIWKIYCDNNPKANTISKFRNAINRLLRNDGNISNQVKREKINNDVESKLKAMRRQFLAHSDMSRNSSRIEISELKDLLDTICKEFNCICDVIDDERVVNVSEINIGLQEMSCHIELLSLYNQI